MNPPDRIRGASLMRNQVEYSQETTATGVEAMTDFASERQDLVTASSPAGRDLITAEELNIRMGPPAWPGALPTFWHREHIVDTTDHDESLRKLPYATRGRDHETAHIAVKLQSMPTSITLIMGAPGSGKTALLENIILYQRAKGCTIRRLTPASFNTNVDLANAILGVTDPAKGLPTSAQTRLEGEVQAGVSATHARGAIGKDETVEVDRSAVWYQAITIAGREASDAGTLFVIDEAQDLGLARRETEKWERIQQFLQVMNSTILAGSEDKPPKVALLASGLTNLGRLLNAFGMSRIENHAMVRMGPLSARAMEQILVDHVSAKTENGKSLPKPPDGLIEKMIDAAGGTAHHIAGAGLALQTIAKEVASRGENKWSDDDQVAAQELATESRRGLYSNRVAQSLSMGERQAAGLLAYATKLWGPQLPIEGTERLIMAIAKRHGENAEEMEQNLIRKGVLDQREDSDIYPTVSKKQPRMSHMAFSIHSMATYLNERMDRDPKGDEVKRKADKLIRKHFGKPTKQYMIPAWQWDDTQKVPTLKSLPTAFPRPWDPPAPWLTTAGKRVAELKNIVKGNNSDQK